jgi:adenylyltransferase/sulfurtransferase
MQADFTRYSCQIALPGFGEKAQQSLQQARALIVGAGGLGCPAAQYLVASGIGKIGVADYDVIGITNLHRQILYTPAEVGLKKVAVLVSKLQAQNPSISLVGHDLEITADNVLELVAGYDMVVDCTDNFDTKYLLNDACLIAGKPLVYAAIYQYEGQVAVWNVLGADGIRSSNYRDLFPEVNASQIPNCAKGGVIPTLAGMIGCLQANEVIKYFTGIGELLSGKLLIVDALTNTSRIFNIPKSTNSTVNTLLISAKIPVITYNELQNSYQAADYDLIDVRTLDERNKFHIGGRHIPLSELENNIAYLDMSKAIVCYCASGRRSAEAIKILRSKFKDGNFFSLKGGINALPIPHSPEE